MKTMYHATAYSNLFSIVDKGILPGVDGIVYLADTSTDAMKFIAIRVIGEPILVLEVAVDENYLEETFDHSYSFFKARAWGYPSVIPWASVTNAWKFL